jgi:pyruvate/2-oxoglutarate dehydrogenase complex dihydrolipoamide acyltransferase (E2) component
LTDKFRDETARETVRPATERAEELVDRATRGASYLASLAAMRLMRGASLAREEAEDIWAEAQSLRYHQRQGVEPDAGGGDAVAPGVQHAATTVTDTVQNAAHQAAASTGSMVEGATEAVRSKAEELGLMETPTIRVTEAARRKAEEMGVALAGLQGTGAGGQITVEDVKKRARAERP